MTDKETFREFCLQHKVHLFMQPFWLDSAGHSWNVLTAKSKGLIAFWVFHIEKKMGFTFIRNPHLTPYTGIIFSNNQHEHGLKQELLNTLIQKLPPFDVMELDLPLSVSTDFDFYPLKSNPKITNIIDLKNKDVVYGNFKPALQRQIRKAERSLTIYESDDIELFYSLHQKSFVKQNKKAPVPFAAFKKYWKTCREQHCGNLFFIKDEEQNIHAAFWLAYDDDTAYYLAGGTDTAFYGSGAMSKLMWHAIETSFNLNKKYFDFEGSMLPAVNRFFNNFSPVEHTYIHLRKINSLIYKIIKKKK